MGIEQFGTVIYKVYAGSRSYGTNITEEMAQQLAKRKGGKAEDYISDVDIRGIFIPHRQYLIGPQKMDEYKDPNEEDTVYFSLEKFVRLALECNPNVVEQLFTRDEDVIYMNDVGKELRSLRYLFLTKNAFGRFGSYAWSQLNRMTNRTNGFQRNEKRQKLIEFTGGEWDPKNAMHLIRLLHMLLEILNDGTLHTFCSYKDLLLSIRNGELSAEEVIDMANHLFAQAEIALKNSTIPNVPDFHKMNDWVVRSIDKVHGMEANIGLFPSPTLKNLPLEYEMIDKCTMFLVSNPLIRKKNKSEAQGMVIPFKDWFTGLYTFNEFKFEDTTIEFIHKFAYQARMCNPRHIDTIFAPEEAFLHKHPMTVEFLELMRLLPVKKRAYATAKGYLKGNLAQMNRWEELKEKHTTLREQVKEQKAIPRSYWDEQFEKIEKNKTVLTATFEQEYNTLFEQIIAIDSHEGKENWRVQLTQLNQDYRHEMESLREQKSTVTQHYQRWTEMVNKKGNMALLPPFPDQTHTPNASAIGKFSYDTILASELFHYASLYIELIETGTVLNSRAYEDEMYAIKHGKYKTYAAFQSHMLGMIEKLDNVYVTSKLRTQEVGEIQEKLIDLINRYHKTL